MTKIDRDKIVRAALGSARLEGYKGQLKAAPAAKPSAPKAAKAARKSGAAAKR